MGTFKMEIEIVSSDPCMGCPAEQCCEVRTTGGYLPGCPNDPNTASYVDALMAYIAGQNRD